MLHFLGIGAQKAGTTWLYAQLAKHPEVSFPGGKEVHFWNKQYHHGIPWYQSLFAIADGRKHGDITPAYGFLEMEKIKQIKELYPDLRLIYMVRNPFERAWSGALMALRRAEMQLDEASDQWFIDHFRSRGSLARGDYQACIRNWRSVFGEEAILILKFEDMQVKPLEMLLQVAGHLSIGAERFCRIPDDELHERHNEGTGAKLRPSLYPVLSELYAPKIEMLQKYLSIDYSYVLNY